MSSDLLRRAFELADSGRCINITAVRRALERERFEGIDGHFAGTGLKKQLLDRIEKARALTSKVKSGAGK